MSSNAPIEADEVHVVEAGAARGSRLGMIVLLVLLLAVAGGGAWVVIEEPFGDQGVVELPAPADDNLLGDAWSFETGESGGPGDHWRTDDGAAAGFGFGERGAVSGRAAASASPEDGAWAAMVSRRTWRVDARSRAVQLAAATQGAGLRLVVRFLAEGLPPLDALAASGDGVIAGSVTAPRGYGEFTVVIASVGPGSVDDVSLTLAGEGAEPTPIGVYEVLAGDPPGLSVSRGQDLVLRVDPPGVRPAEGRLLPGALALNADGSALMLADGTSVSHRRRADVVDGSLQVTTTVGGLASDAQLVRSVLVAGSLADEPVGIRSSRGYERYTGDFAAQGVDALVLGGTQDRLVLSSDHAFDLTATHQADGSVALTMGFGAGEGDHGFTLKGSFQEERVEAAQLRDQAAAAEQAGDLGLALQLLNRVLTDYPYDEQVLEQATAGRARLELQMQERLDALRGDLEDALFLGSAQRCKEVRAEAERLAGSYAGSDSEARFREMAATVDAEAASLLAEEETRRRRRVEALGRSFRESGAYPSLAAEFEETLERFFDGEDP